MKKTQNIILAIFVLVTTQLFCSCDEWLDVSPSTDVSMEEQFLKASGFEETLYGMYIAMGRDNLYGHQLSYGWIEKLAKNHFDKTQLGWYGYDYEDQAVKVQIASTWKSMYGIIANANAILDNIDQKKDLFDEREFNILKGEALTIRAFLHFDLYRLFGKNYSKYPEESAVPFVNKYGPFVFKHLKASELIQAVLDDLTLAETLLEGNDPVIEDEELNGFLEKRKDRLNYYTEVALKARIYT